ncbi:SHC-transforming protein 3 [Protopterus annectens]|uniref:SHC-transforming protein 3 n=1 Tax=Protopterus annectens TaxID=7888 RepID=UPI001CF98735|nr:SHC-transforming protein 3 [Protopterus annectens]
MLHRTKYNRFRNDSVTSVDDLIHNLSMSGKVSAVTTTSAVPTYMTSTEVLSKDHEDGPNTICTFIHKVSNLKLTSTGSLLGIKNLSSAVKELAVSKLQGSSGATTSAAGASDNTCNLVSASACSQQDVSKMNTVKKARSVEMQLGGEDWNPSGSFFSKPSRGWLHPCEKILGPGVTYVVKYLGCIEVLRSMRSLDFNTRTQITREAISRVCEAVPGTKGAFKKRKPPSKALASVLGKSNLQFAGMSITLNISTSSLNLMTPDSKQIIANHHMQSISFASGGDPDTTDYVAYVAKDPVNRRACHILECCDGLAQDVISTIGQAFELRFKQYLQCPSKLHALHDRSLSLDDVLTTTDEGDILEHQYYNRIPNKMPPPGGIIDARTNCIPSSPVDIAQSPSVPGQEQIYYQGRSQRENLGDEWRHAPIRQDSFDLYSPTEVKPQLPEPRELPSYVNTQTIDVQNLVALQDITNAVSPKLQSTKESPRKDIFDMKPFEDALKCQPARPLLNKAASADSPILAKAAAVTIQGELMAEPWYHGEMSRKEAEHLLTRDGDFLVRSSATNSGCYVLTGMQNSLVKHLLLVDPEGTVRTKDHIFENISHLINYHREKNLPIVSSGSELCLKQPVDKK